MRRRRFIAGLGGAAALWPLAAMAQVSAPDAALTPQPRSRLVGVLVHKALGLAQFERLFQSSLRQMGYVEGKNIRLEFRSDDGQASRLPALAAELVRLNVDVIVTWFTPAATAAKAATKSIPIVCADCGDPVGTGLAASLAQPGGNLTGIAAGTAQLSGKMVEFIREIPPSDRRVVVLVNAPDPFSKSFLAQTRLAGKAIGTAIDPIMIRDAGQLDAAFAAIRKNLPAAVIVQPSLPTKRVAKLALEERIPAACADREFVYAGGLMAYYPEEAEIYRRAAVFVRKILNGANPADLPIEQPTRFALAINLQTAQVLGLTLPPALLARADEIIE
jgi:putative tryptophan/tyrosine transport system substrate-binding protein